MGSNPQMNTIVVKAYNFRKIGPIQCKTSKILNPPNFFWLHFCLKLWYFVDKQVMFEKGTDVVEGTEKKLNCVKHVRIG